MTALLPERWQQIKSIFDEALEIPLDARSAWLHSATSEDPLLYSQVSELLAYYEEDEGFLDWPGPESGLHFGVYRTIRTLGRGGMGTVYLGQRDDGSFERLVAIKEMTWLPGLGFGQERFLAERRMLALLEHPHIARLYDAGVSEGGTPYFVMEYVDGYSLTEFCRELDPDRGTRIELFRQLCSAVEAAHAKGVFHGDLKPANILVSASGQVKLVDFGVASYLDTKHDSAATPLSAAYCSPERLKGASVQAPGDIYSLGVILYELVTGEHPFRRAGDFSQKVMERLASETPMPGIGDRDLNSVIARATAQDPSARYASMTDLLRDVARLQAGRPVKGRHSRWLFALVALILLFSGAVYWQWSQRQVRQAIRLRLSSAALFQHQIQNMPGVSQSRQAMRDEALRATQAAIDLDDKEEALRRQVARANRRLGELVVDHPYLEFGSASDALSHFNAARRLLESVEADEAGRLELASVQASQGSALFSLGQNEEAEKLLRQAVTQMEAVPSSAANRDRELAGALLRLGVVLLEQPGAAIPFLERSLALRQALSSVVEDELALVNCLSDLSRAQMREGERAHAYAAQAVQLARAARVRYPESYVHKLSLASALSQQAAVDSSLDFASEAAVVAEDLYRQDPTNGSVGSLLAGKFFMLGDTQHAANDFEGARLSYQKSFGIAFQLHRSDPANTQHSKDAALAKDHVGNEEIELKRYVEARVEIGKALQIYDSIPIEAKREIGWLSSYGIALGHLARSFARAGDHAAAAPVFERMLANHEVLLAKDPGRANWRLSAAMKYAEAAHSRIKWARGVTSKKARAQLLLQAQAWNQHALDIFFDLESKKQINKRWLPYLEAARRDRRLLQH